MTDEDAPLETSLSGYELLNDPLLNKGTAFSEAEREEFDLHGLLPPHVGALDEQIARRLRLMRSFATDLERYAFLRELQDTNETLFYALIAANLEETLPLVYTPTVGLGCQQFSGVFRKPRGLFLSYPHKERMRRILGHPRYDAVEVIVATDGERILGLGDQGAGGMGIPIGKLSLYTACGGVHPAHTLPILLDVGTDNPERLSEPVYVGWRHERVRGAEYDAFLEAFVAAVEERWGGRALLQFEDFSRANATRLLARYRDRVCCFNDDIQGTAAVATGALLAAINVAAAPLGEQRIAVLGAGSAGCGIAGLLFKAMAAAGLSERDARARLFLIDRDGLLVEGMPGLLDFQKPFAQSRAAVSGWRLEQPDRIGLRDVVRNARPTALIGASGQPGAFTEAAVREMAAQVARPVILPLSNPTSRSEAEPADLLAWTEGRAVIGAGSPFPPVLRDGRLRPVDQTNNSYVFPGVGLGVIASGARRVTDAMFMAAAQALADASPARADPDGNLLPPVAALRDVAFRVACAVARQAEAEGLAPAQSDDAALQARIAARMWTPRYRPYRRVRRLA